MSAVTAHQLEYTVVVFPPCILDIHTHSCWLWHDLGGDASAAVLEDENMRLREREQALMDAVG
jgi:hypothetical protein